MDNDLLKSLPEDRQEELVERHDAFWGRDEAGGALLGFSPKSGLFPLSRLDIRHEGPFGPEHVTAELLKADLTVRPPIDVRDDLFPKKIPLEPIPWAEGYCGADVFVSAQAQMAWTKPLEQREVLVEDLKTRLRRDWLDKLVWATESNVQASQMRHLVSESLLRGPADCLESIVGAQNLCLLLYDDPESVLEAGDWLADRVIELAKAQNDVASWYRAGTVNRYGVWGRGANIVTQADVSELFSTSQFREVLLPAYRKIAAAFDKVTIHFHSAAWRHADALLSVEEFAAVEWGLDPTGPTLEDMIPILARMLEKKPVILMNITSESETRMLLDRLPHGGLCIIQRKDY